MGVLQIRMMYKGASSHAVSISPDPMDASSTSPTPASVVGTASVTGGVGPFTYAWSIVTGGGVTLTNTTSAACTLTTNTGTPQTRVGTIKCDVTDTGNGSLVASRTVSYTLDIV